MEDYMEIDMSYPPESLDYIQHLPWHNQFELRDQYITALSPVTVERLMGREVLYAAYSTKPISQLYLSCNGVIGALTWETSPPGTEETMMKWVSKPEAVVGFIRNQFQHRLCWCFVSTDMLSSGCLLHGWEDVYCPFSPWYLCLSCNRALLGKDKKSHAGHVCYAYSHLFGMQYIEAHGVTKVEVERQLVDFDCTKVPPLPPLGEAASMSERVRGVRRIATLEEALNELKFHPVACNLVHYNELFDAEVYTGPRRAKTDMLGVHVVIMLAVTLYQGKLVALCKMSNGESVAFGGYVLVCLSTMYMFVGSVGEHREMIWQTPRPVHLLSDFVVLDMHDNKKENDEKKPGHSNDEKGPETPKENISKTPLSTVGLYMAGSTSSSVSVERSSPEYVRGPVTFTRYMSSSSFPVRSSSTYSMSVPPPVSSSSSVAVSSSSSVAGHGSSSISVAGSSSSSVAGLVSSSVAGPVSSSSSVSGMNQYQTICLETAEPKTESSKITRASNAQKHINFDDVGSDGSLKPLQEVLVGQTDQKGSRVLPEKRRFDISHGKPVDHEDLRMIESTVNKQIEGELDVFLEEAVILPEAKRIKVSGEVYCDPARVRDECEFDALNVAASHEKEAEDASKTEEKVDP